MNILDNIYEAMMDGNVAVISELTQKALDENIEPKTIINDGLLKAMNVIGELFKNGEMFVPEVLMSAKTMDVSMEVLKPFLKEDDLEKKGKIIFATVKGDLHDIGKKLCIMMLEGAGYEVVNLGVDVSPEKIVEKIKEYNPDIVAMSAMLTTTMTSMKKTIDVIKENNLYEKVKIMVGGAPVTKEFAQRIGAEYSSDASSAVELANKLLIS